MSDLRWLHENFGLRWAKWKLQRRLCLHLDAKRNIKVVGRSVHDDQRVMQLENTRRFIAGTFILRRMRQHDGMTAGAEDGIAFPNRSLRRDEVQHERDGKRQCDCRSDGPEWSVRWWSIVVGPWVHGLFMNVEQHEFKRNRNVIPCVVF